VRLTFEKERALEPVIWELGKKFDIVTNIRRANIEWDCGWVILQIEGAQDEIDAALKYARDTGVRVDPVEGTVVE
jgi:ABC-type methionine transport system ATPase subunit